jgi:hypothetical protein
MHHLVHSETRPASHKLVSYESYIRVPTLGMFALYYLVTFPRAF